MKPLLAALALASFPLAAAAQDPVLRSAPPGAKEDPNEITGNAFLFLGGKQLDESDWDPLEDQLEIAALLDARAGTWPINIACDFRYSYDEDDVAGIDISGATFEFNLGVRKYIDFQPGGFHLFFGGGLTLGYGRIETSGLGATTDTGYGGGFWLDAGAMFALPNGLAIGFEVGYSRLPVEFDDLNVDAEAGGVRFGVVVGFHW